MKKTSLFDIFNYAFLFLLMIASAYPFLYVIFASVSEPGMLLQQNGLLFAPVGFNLEGYKLVFQEQKIWTGYMNTIFYVVMGTSLNIIMTSMLAYVLSRENVYWNKLFMTLVVITLFFSGGLVPTYLLVRNLGLLETRWALILPVMISTWNLMIMRTNFKGLPVSLDEAARIDGANDFLILFRIVLPLSMPVVAVMIMYYGVAHWNSWFNAMLYLQRRHDLLPLQMILREILITNNTQDIMSDVGQGQRAAVEESLKYAAIVVATVPILSIYPFLQKHFVKGIMIGAVKG